MTPYGYMDLDQHWLWEWHAAWRHQATTWTNIDFLSVCFCVIHLNAKYLPDIGTYVLPVEQHVVSQFVVM